jgi:formylglycine-generating enzyme required for sulfatase activity
MRSGRRRYRPQCGSALIGGFVLLALAGLGFVDPRAIAQGVPAQELPTVVRPGADFRDCANSCPIIVAVPAAAFMMGSPESDPDRRSTEGPQHGVMIARPFAIAKFEVTFSEWNACVAAAVCPRVEDRWGRAGMPVIDVSWDDARQYAGWLSRVTGQLYRLRTEAEWEYAARAGATTRYSWGDDPATGSANCDGCGGEPSRLQTFPVGSFKPNAFGLHDMHGNVWEWVEDCWHESYSGAPGDGTAWLEGCDPGYRVIRGGSWHNESELVRAATRFRRNIHVRFDALGFRVARTIGP